MKRILIVLLVILCSCTSANNEVVFNEHKHKEINIPQEENTKPVPEEYKNPANKQGSLEDFEYEALDYIRNEKVTKHAIVYLPYGYDENDLNTRYDIFYLLHGWEGHAGEFFEYENIKNVIDNLIEKKEMAPAIIVSPSFYNEYSPIDYDSSIVYMSEFYKEFVDTLMPLIEEKYHTFAKSSSKEDLIASRDHRIFGGFSMGSAATWYQFIYNSEYIHYYIPMSAACWYYGDSYEQYPVETADLFESVIKEKNLNEKGYYIYAAVGTDDYMMDQMDYLFRELFQRETFDQKHIVYYQKIGGIHDHVAVQEYLYNVLPLMLNYE